MRVFIAGIDGYLGWALAQYLTARGHAVAGADLFLRRQWVEEMGSWSATPVVDIETRLAAFEENFGTRLLFRTGDLCDYEFVETFFKEFQPEAIVHLGEMPSAPYSMQSVKHAAFTMNNNIVSTLNILFAMRDVVPDSHLVKLGTMGEYGTPNIDIPEGFFEIEYRGRKDTLPFPRQAGSWYHQTKVHDSNNVLFACKIWGLRSTDIMQGVVFGTRIDEMGDDERLLSRFDFDESFGTAINRFCAMSVIGHPLTPFGKGNQKRGFLPMRDSMQCLTLAIENPPITSAYRVFNQFEEVYSVNELADKVVKVAQELGLKDAVVRRVENPRKEMEEHYYKPDHQHLFDLGYQPTHDMEAELRIMINDLVRYRDRIEAKRDLLIPEIRWDGTRQKVGFIGR
ncbi:MAG: NAD-dependent epimerase/dehydratase family protein [Anaerolineae bacterium]|nr:NAD-dependent epimerase/dehydratase family protein [Anaerolineae bacterium]